ncbi:hypothetical protein ENTCAN_07963 [Enterobacter cancerogenus ATCC 35316]|nr:hypothetical protein ENTCAN_07963 [Enterobacter cancerogenus ATCC 35316]
MDNSELTGYFSIREFMTGAHYNSPLGIVLFLMGIKILILKNHKVT